MILGQGTQHIFENDPRVLYISIHRYDNGKFFPKSSDSDYTEVGSGIGRGFNVNIPWNKKGMADMEYMLAFQAIVMPIAYDFNPELVLVSAGFDAAIGDQLGGCKVSPEAYGYFTHWLSALANGRIILCLEGGYNVNSISHSMSMCTKALFSDPLPLLHISSRWNGISSSALETLRNVMQTQSEHWKCLKFNKKLPDFDVNDNKIHDVLVRGMDEMKLDSPVDGDDGKVEKKEIKEEDAGQASSSRSVEKKQTLADYLAENAAVSCRTKSFALFSLKIQFQALEKEEMFAVVPKKNCPHLCMLKPTDAPDCKFLFHYLFFLMAFNIFLF